MYYKINFLKRFSFSISKGLLNLRIIVIIYYEYTNHKEEYKQEKTTDTSASIVCFSATFTKTYVFYFDPSLEFTTFELF